jgi:LemA protein
MNTNFVVGGWVGGWSSALWSRLLLCVALVFAFALPGCEKYDELVARDQDCQAKWSDYEGELQRRSDLIPGLVETVKGASKFEASTLTQITQARADATSIKLQADDFTDPAKMEAFQKAQDKLSHSSLSRLLIANENYPQLQASARYGELMKQLEATENRVLRGRQQYNNAVRGYNTELGKIKGSVVNKATGKPFKPRVYFAATAGSEVAPKVSF